MDLDDLDQDWDAPAGLDSSLIRTLPAAACLTRLTGGEAGRWQRALGRLPTDIATDGTRRGPARGGAVHAT